KDLQPKEVLPKAGLVVSEKGNLTEVLCKPKILPLKSITLQKLEDMEARVAELQQQQQAAATSGPKTAQQFYPGGNH
ncbi:BBSome-interacting protein 1, partial [Haematococcus lacustris]